MIDIKDWAKKEIEIYDSKCENDWCTKEVLNRAYELFEELCDEDPLVRRILNKLINRKPLLPLEDNEEDWKCVYFEDNISYYQNKRYSALFKTVFHDGTIEYSDAERWQCHNDTGDRLLCSVVNNYLNKMFPITFPYYPEQEYVYIEEFRASEDSEYYDMLYMKYKDVEAYFTSRRKGFLEPVTKEEYTRQFVLSNFPLAETEEDND